MIASGLTGPLLAAYGWWVAFGIVLLFVDVAVQRLPARLSYTAAIGFLTLAGVDALVHNVWHPWIRSVLGGLLAASVLAVSAIALPRLLHWGDVRYALSVGTAATFVGWISLYTAAFLWTFFAAIVGVFLIMTRRATMSTHLPQGPFLFAGTLLAVVLLRL